MSSISPLSSQPIYAATPTPASAASSSPTGSASNQAPVDTPKDTVSLTRADAREVFQLGRVAYNQQADNITSAQATQLDSLIKQVQTAVTSDLQANGGALTSTQAQTINQQQDGISKEIYANSNDLSNGKNDITPPSIPPG